MICPICHADTKVIDSRSVDDNMIIRRRRECLDCQFRFSTHEHIQLLDIQVIKRDGRRESYQSSKLESGLRIALEKRPVDEEAIHRLLAAIELEIQKLSQSEVSSQTIGHIVMDQLRDFDPVAYVRFVSVHKSFKDLQSFINLISKLKNTNS